MKSFISQLNEYAKNFNFKPNTPLEMRRNYMGRNEKYPSSRLSSNKGETVKQNVFSLSDQKVKDEKLDLKPCENSGDSTSGFGPLTMTE